MKNVETTNDAFGCNAKTLTWHSVKYDVPPTDEEVLVYFYEEFHISGTGRKWDKWFWDSSCISDYSERSKFRSKTFLGIAKAMAEQWGKFIEEQT